VRLARASLLAALLALVLSAGVVAAEAARPLQTGVLDPRALRGANYNLGLKRIRGSGATLVRAFISWPAVAPNAPAAGTDFSDPANPAYRWDAFDAKLRALDAAGLEAIVGIGSSPAWARQRGENRRQLPEPRRLAEFAQAAARRYDGSSTPGLPRVRFWQLWNEPNVSFYFQPQLGGDGKPVSPLLYRQLLQAFTPGIRRGNPAARVVAGGTSPFGRRSSRVTVVAPLRFLRDVVCVSAGTPRRTCRTRVPFDIWAHHPYTSRGPTGAAIRADDVSLGDLRGVRRLLTAAQRLGQVQSPQAVELWVTEFSWDSSPPDPAGVPAALHARWAAEALYRAWSSGVSAFIWFALRDEPAPPASVYQSGLWYRGASFARDRPKPALQAFRFPLVAFPDRGRVFVWGRTPAGRPGTVILERSFRGGWGRLGRLATNEHGIFTARFGVAAKSGFVRARLVGSRESARPFSLVHPGDHTYNPFGS
jgi:hypothetical protein